MRNTVDLLIAFAGCFPILYPAAAGAHYAERSYRSWLGAAYQYGRSDIRFGKAERAAGEFRYRHPLTKLLVRWGLRHRGAAARLASPAGLAIRAAEAAGLEPLGQRLCGAIFNLHYWFGVADQLGQASRALALAREPAGRA